MTDEVKMAVLKVLQEANMRGLAMEWSCWSIYTDLSRWKRFWNWFMMKLGAECPPFVDTANYHKCKAQPLDLLVDKKLINEAMKELAPESVCKVCGSKNLRPDPASYYCHAEDYSGAPLLCLDHPEHLKFNTNPNGKNIKDSIRRSR